MYDAIIIGTGPTGATTARCTAAGLDTLIVEKEILPRVKICGGALFEYALSNLGARLPHSLIERECFGTRIRYGIFWCCSKRVRLGVSKRWALLCRNCLKYYGFFETYGCLSDFY